jgi:hypothetical protein
MPAYTPECAQINAPFTLDVQGTVCANAGPLELRLPKRPRPRLRRRKRPCAHICCMAALRPIHLMNVVAIWPWGLRSSDRRKNTSAPSGLPPSYPRSHRQCLHQRRVFASDIAKTTSRHRGPVADSDRVRRSTANSPADERYTAEAELLTRSAARSISCG